MTDKRQALIRQLSVVFFAEGMTREEALSDATTFVDEAMKLGREGKRKRVKLKCTTCKHGQAHGPGGARRCELASGELTYNDEPPGWCPLRGVAVEETSQETRPSLPSPERLFSDALPLVVSDQLAELARKVGTNAVKIGMPYQDADGRWLMDLRGGSVLSFKDEQEARSFGGRWDAQREALKEASASPSRCEIVGDTLRLRDVYGSSVCVLDLREVSFVRRLADEYSDGTATVWIVLRVGETLKLDLPTAADYERVADHVASLRGRA